MKKVSIVGSGNVGVNSAFFIAETAAAHVTLVDIKEGISAGKALDLMEAAPIRRYRTKIDGSDDIAAIAGSDVVVIAAGLIRAPGRDRASPPSNFRRSRPRGGTHLNEKEQLPQQAIAPERLQIEPEH